MDKEIRVKQEIPEQWPSCSQAGNIDYSIVNYSSTLTNDMKCEASGSVKNEEISAAESIEDLTIIKEEPSEEFASMESFYTSQDYTNEQIDAQISEENLSSDEITDDDENQSQDICQQKEDCHITSSYSKKVKIFHCLECGQAFPYKSNLSMHMDNVHLKTRKFRCPLCRYKSCYKKSLEFHINKLHGEIDYELLKLKYHHCKHCYFKTFQKQELFEHIMKKHSSFLDTALFQCDYCMYAALEQMHLLDHIQRCHIEINEFQCYHLYCEFNTDCKTKLHEHIKDIHIEFWQIKCKYCEFRANSKSALNFHIDAIHLKERACWTNKASDNEIFFPYTQVHQTVPGITESEMNYVGECDSKWTEKQKIAKQNLNCLLLQKRIPSLPPANYSEDCVKIAVKTSYVKLDLSHLNEQS